MTGALLVFLGGGTGAVLRHGVNQLAPLLLGAGAFPLSTLLVNVLGSVLMGGIAVVLPLEGPARLFAATGLLGGFTTFSAFSADAVMLWQRGDQIGALAYVTASVLLSIGGLAAGIALVRG